MEDLAAVAALLPAGDSDVLVLSLDFWEPDDDVVATLAGYQQPWVARLPAALAETVAKACGAQVLDDGAGNALVVKADFDESKYQRDDHGRFAEGSGSGESPSAKPPAPSSPTAVAAPKRSRAEIDRLSKAASKMSHADLMARKMDSHLHRKHSAVFEEEIEPADRRALKHWSNEGYAGIRAHLAGEPLPPGFSKKAVEANAKALVEAVSVAEVIAREERFEEKRLYRGLALPKGETELMSRLLTSGSTVALKGPSSWSVNPLIAKQFAKDKGGARPVILHVKTRAGLAMPASVKPKSAQELETVLMSKSYRVVKHEMLQEESGKDSALFVTLEEIDPVSKAVGTTTEVAVIALGEAGEDTYVIGRDFWQPDDDVCATLDGIDGAWFMEVPAITDLAEIAKRARTVLTSPLALGAVFATSEPVAASDDVDILSEAVTDGATEAEQAIVAKALSHVRIAKTGEERFVLGVVLEPDTVDSQGDFYSEEDVRKAAHSYMEHHTQLGLQHREIVTGKLKILESFVAPVELQIGDHTVRKGTWVMGIRVIDDGLWMKTKKGEFTGFSIGGSAYRRRESYVAKAGDEDGGSGTSVPTAD